MQNRVPFNDTIAAPSTAPGVGAIALIRLSGPEAVSITVRVFSGKNLHETESHTAHFGRISDKNGLIDEVLVTVFRGVRSFTKENLVEISCHGSPYIVRRIMELLLSEGARMARPGEFTQRAFLNGRFDLSAAEAIADLINADSAAAHQAAITQMRGGIAHKIQHLRADLIRFAALLELELDFGEEDVEFADRSQLTELINHMLAQVNGLTAGFAAGNVMKNGVSVVIAGKPNAGKSTLLNRLLQEEKAIVSEIPGTTRDFIEDTMVINGYTFRFTDTAGLRETNDSVEAIGVARSREKIASAAVVLYLFDVSSENAEVIVQEAAALAVSGKPLLYVGNKCDLATPDQQAAFADVSGFISVSAHYGIHIEQLKQNLCDAAALPSLQHTDAVVSNLRHFESLKQTSETLERALSALKAGYSGDLIAADIRAALYFLGAISGEIGTEELLGEIFGKFCIGK